MKLTIFFLLFISISLVGNDNVIRMAYRTTEKLPLIKAAPDNSGLYFDLYTEAARRIGYTLEVVRKPKKRILIDLKRGEIDFYPGFLFSEERSQYIYFINTGITEQNVAVTLDTAEDITSFEDLNGKVYLESLGNVNYLEHIDKRGFTVIEVPEADIVRIIDLLQLGRGDLFIYQLSSVLYTLKMNNITNIKIHKGLLPDVFNLPLGFSQQSSHFESVKNELYDSERKISIDNFPVTLSTECAAYKFQQALQDMYEDGFTKMLYDSYYH